ncbi:MAG: NAD(P)/FAD-dependent oxidoreductase [Burkholderiales bacterium]
MNNHFDVVVVGAGAAGMMCAAQAGQHGRRVLLIEHYHLLGEKIRISGGGRCNFTNIHCKPENFLSQNPRFARSALAHYTPQHFISLVEHYGIGYHEKTLGQLFCDNSAQQIINMLKSECGKGSVELRMKCAVNEVEHSSDNFRLNTRQGIVSSKSLVIATGGLSVPKIGASPFGYRIAEQFGHSIVPPRPALVPLSFEPEAMANFGDLSGLSLDAEVSCNGGRFREAILLTHRGLSGPAILQISSYWQGGDSLDINLLPGTNAEDWLLSRQKSKTRIDNALAEVLPKRFAHAWCARKGEVKPLNQYSEKTLREFAKALQRWQVRPSGTLGYNKAEVTIGGVNTDELSSKTMESHRVPGLYFIGEVVDVTGHLGGFNFQWAWSSGFVAGQSLNKY